MNLHQLKTFFSNQRFQNLIDWNYLASPSGEVKSSSDHHHHDHQKIHLHSTSQPVADEIIENHQFKSPPRKSKSERSESEDLKRSPPKIHSVNLVDWYRTSRRPKFVACNENDVIDDQNDVTVRGKRGL